MLNHIKKYTEKLVYALSLDAVNYIPILCEVYKKLGVHKKQFTYAVMVEVPAMLFILLMIFFTELVLKMVLVCELRL